MPRALLSVSDKSGVIEFARALTVMGWDLLSTGGTAKLLRDAGLPVRDVSEVTGHPEMMDGRVKTLHPAVHAGILARRDRPGDLAALEEHGYQLIDMVVVNLYPFHEAASAGSELPVAMEKVDIGGPTMLRSAAKNFASLLVVVDPQDYEHVLAALRDGRDTAELRRELAGKVFAHTAGYDAAIAEYFGRFSKAAGEWPASMRLDLTRVQSLRYGENPDQGAAFYAESSPPPGSLPHMRQLHGKELSFNNLLDVEAAVTAASAFAGGGPACVIIKHTTPCGVAVADSPIDAYRLALKCDPVSAFGGIVAVNGAVDAELAAELAGTFLEIIVAPSFDDDARAVLMKKKNLRLIELPVAPAGATELDVKRVRGGYLVQQRMSMSFPDEVAWRVVTRRQPTAGEMNDMRFAWRVSASVKSNAIVIAAGGRTLGIGAGQMSRVDSSRLAVMKARDQNADTNDAALASDAFFPFRDGIDAAAQAGIACIIQPGGSVRDDEVIAAADEHGMAMVFTGRRVFRH